jgi:UDP-glucose 4-epimerase
MRAFVTGAAGFIGSTLVDRLLADGHGVVAVDNLSTGSSFNLDAARRTYGARRDRFTFVEIDIQATEFGDVVEGSNPDVIVHLAAQANERAAMVDPQAEARTNVLGTINVLEAARRAGVRRIVYATSGGYRPGSLPVGDAAVVQPMSLHAAGKLAGELYLHAYAHTYGIAPISLALADDHGTRRSTGGAAESVNGIGGSSVTVDDVVDAFVRAIHTPAGTVGVFTVGTGLQTTTAETYRPRGVLGPASLELIGA